MKEIVSFSKEIDFKGLVNKITKISLEHTLIANEDNTITGDFIVQGSYKMTNVSITDNDFSYKIPVSIEMNSDYDLSNVIIDIDNFTYEIIDEEKLKVYIDVLIDNIVKKEKEEEIKKEDELVCESDLFLEDEEEKEKLEVNDENYRDVKESTCITDDKEEIEEKEEEKEENKSEEVQSLFSSFDNSLDTYMSYSVHIMRDGDNIDTVITKYKTNKDVLSSYNDLDNIKIGTKIIIPSEKNDK